MNDAPTRQDIEDMLRYKMIGRDNWEALSDREKVERFDVTLLEIIDQHQFWIDPSLMMEELKSIGELEVFSAIVSFINKSYKIQTMTINNLDRIFE